MSKVRILYDFQAEGANELTAFSGEEFTVTNANAFDGWIQVRNLRGEEGIVPSSYVEYLNTSSSSAVNHNLDDDDIPPPPSYVNAPSSSSYPTSLPTSTSYTSGYQNQSDSQVLDDFDPFANTTSNNNDNNLATNFEIPSNWETNNNNSYSNNNNTKPNLPENEPAGLVETATSWNNSNDSWSNANNNSSSWGNTNTNSSWGNNTTTTNNNSNTKTNTNQNSFKNQTSTGTVNKRHSDDYDSSDFDDDAPHNASNHSTNRTLSTTAIGNAGTLKPKVRNSYGLDVFLLYGAVKNVPDSDRFSSIILNEQRQSVWKRQSPPYLVNIIGYHSDKKYHGVKKFTSYEIQAQIFPQKVRRRYNHFDWLHKRLEEKFGYSICIPPLPDKAVTGNFEDEFIAKRKAQLELWLNRMSAHPVIGQSEVFVHFLQCDDASNKWKAGKRKAEKDEYRGAQWYCTLTVPGESVDTTVNIKERVDKFARATINLDNCIKNVSIALEKIAGFHTTTYKKEFTHFGKKLEEFGLSLSNDALDAPNNSALSTALVTAGNTYTQIGNLYGEQSKTDINLLLDRFGLYRGIAQQMPDIVAFEKQSIQLYEEFQQKPEKLEGRPFVEVAPRREIISHVTFAEINQFNKDKVDDFNNYMKQYLQQQIAFYTEITECLKRAYANFEKIPTQSTTTSTLPQQNQSFRR